MMKNVKEMSLFGICMLLLNILPLNAQDKTTFQKRITVQGSAEMEVIPDEIYFTISLKEYEKDRKKISISQLEKQLARAVSKLDIPEENFQVENIYGYNWNHRKKKSDNFLASKSYRLKLPDLNKMNTLLEQLDDKGIQSVNISNFSHSKIEEFRRQLKLKALIAAKEKAGFLLAGINEKLGGVLEVSEVELGSPISYKSTRAFSNAALEYAESDLAGPANIDFKTIKLRFVINAVFGIE